MSKLPHEACNRTIKDLRTALAAAEARIATLEAELAAQRDRAAECLFERNEAQAHANALRDALENVLNGPAQPDHERWCNRGVVLDECDCGAVDEWETYQWVIETKRLIAQTPAASLAAHDAEVLERAASICDKARAIAAGRTDDRSTVKASMYELVEYIVTECADHIRALAAQEVKP